MVLKGLLPLMATHFEVIVHTVKSEHMVLEERENHVGVRASAIGRWLQPLCICEGLKATLASDLPGLFHGHGLWQIPVHYMASIARRRQIPYVISPHGMLEPWALAHRRTRKKLAMLLFQRKDLAGAACLHATCESEHSSIRCCGLENPIAVVPNGVDIPMLCERDVTDSEHVILFISRIHPKKGLTNLVEAWGRLRPKGWRAIIAGPSQAGHEQEIKFAVREAGLEDQFEFRGPVYGRTKWELYRTADVFVLPTFSENFGIVVAEALACGKPVITTKGTPWRELETHECGWWIDIGVEPLEAALREAMELAGEQRMEMGLRGRRLVEQNYSWQKVAGQMIAVYRWVLGQGPKPDCVRLD